MAKTATSITIDSDIKAKAQELFADFGLDLSTAINMFLRQSIRENSIPFSISRNVPNADTVAAMREAEEMKKHPDQYKSYGSAVEMMEDIFNVSDQAIK